MRVPLFTTAAGPLLARKPQHQQDEWWCSEQGASR